MTKRAYETAHEMNMNAGLNVGGQNADAPKFSGAIPPQLQQAMSGESAVKKTVKMPTNESVMYSSDQDKINKVMELIRASASQYEEVTLPSLGRFYDGKNGPSDGILHIRPMTGREEEILASDRLTASGKALGMIFSNCIRENYDVDNFLTEDRVYLLIYLRGISFTELYDAQMTCAECGESFPTTINLDTDLEMDYCPDNFGIENLTGTLPVSNLSFTYRYLSQKEFDASAQRKTEMVKKFGAKFADEILSYRLSLAVKEVEGVSGQALVQTLLKEMHIKDFNYLTEMVFKPPFGVKTSLDVTCPICSQNFTTEMPIDSSFFYPKTKAEMPA